MEMSDERAQAIKRLKEKSGFQAHLLAYVLVNAGLVVIWAMTNPTWPFFWPAFAMIGWGIGLVFHGWSIYGMRYSEEQIEREMQRLKGPGGRRV